MTTRRTSGAAGGLAGLPAGLLIGQGRGEQVSVAMNTWPHTGTPQLGH